ncbi:MAG: MFS transporter [Acidimicrobiales bacterium]
MHGHGNANAHTGPRLDVAPDVHRRRWAILGVLSLSLLITAIDHTIMNVALPRMVVDLGASISQLQWIVDSYTVVFAGLLLAAGALGDRFGRKGALQFGLAAFVGGSLFAALADSASGVIAARAIMGIGGAFIMPATLSILTNAFGDPAERAKAIGIWAGVSGIGVALGPIAGGYLLEHFSWSSVFWLNVPVAIAALVVGHRILPTSKADDGRRLDPIGSVLSITALTALVYSVIEAPSHGWTSGWTVTALSVALVLLVVFVSWEQHHDTPMLEVRFFRNASFSAASVSVTCAFFALAGAIFMVTQYLQFVLGYSPLRAGMGILPAAAAIAVAGPLSAHVAQHVGGRATITAGLVVTSIGLCVQAVFAESTFLPIAVGQALFGLGLGLALAPATDSIMGSLPADRAGVGSAVNDTTREVGSALGVAVIGSIAGSAYADHVSAGVDRLGLPAQVASTVKDNVGAAAHAAGGLDPVTGAELMHVARDGFVSAMHTGMWIGAAVAAAGAVIAITKLPANRPTPTHGRGHGHHGHHGHHGPAIEVVAPATAGRHS